MIIVTRYIVACKFTIKEKSPVTVYICFPNASAPPISPLEIADHTHAAWAIADYGFRVVVSSFFADIFRNNALNNGLLPIRVSEEFLKAVFDEIRHDPKAQFTVDLNNQTLTVVSSGRSEGFEIDAYKKRCLQNGYDDVDYLHSIADRIAAFEAARK